MSANHTTADASGNSLRTTSPILDDHDHQESLMQSDHSPTTGLDTPVSTDASTPEFQESIALSFDELQQFVASTHPRPTLRVVVSESIRSNSNPNRLSGIPELEACERDANEVLVVCPDHATAEYLIRCQHYRCHDYNTLTTAATRRLRIPTTGGRRPYIYLIPTEELFNASLQPSSSGSTMGLNTTASTSGSTTAHQAEPGHNSSFITIFTLWSTMMGTSLLAMPWAINQAGFAFGISLLLLTSAISFYTGHLILKSTSHLAASKGRHGHSMCDFSDVCLHYLGTPGRIINLLFSFLALLGALIVFYVLLVTFLFNVGTFIHAHIYPNATVNIGMNHLNQTYDVVCRHSSIRPTKDADMPTFPTQVTDAAFNVLWNPTRTVPAWLFIVIFPLVSIRSPSFFSKFTALGTISAIYIVILVIIKAVKWGIHMDALRYDVHQIRSSFPSLTGIGALAFFIHNSLNAIMRNNKHQERNTRDLAVAFTLVSATYLSVGILFYISFPMDKSCIEDNFLNNLTSNDILGFLGSVSLFFQIFTIFPLLMYILRVQFMYAVFGVIFPSWIHVSLFHLAVTGICLLFSMFLPSIGTIIRFTGALCGFIYVFTLPVIVEILRERDALRTKPVRSIGADMDADEATPLLSTSSVLYRRPSFLICFAFVAHLLIVLLGAANFAGQFVVLFVGH